MMPKLSGFEVCKKLKGDPATSGIMILMVTALNELGDIERAVQAGTDDFLSKPVNKVELLKRVDNMLKLHHVTDEVERLRQYIEQMESRDEDDLGPESGITRSVSMPSPHAVLSLAARACGILRSRPLACEVSDATRLPARLKILCLV